MQLRETRVASRSPTESSTGLAFIVVFAVVFIILVLVVVLDIVGLRTGVMIETISINTTEAGSHALFGSEIDKIFLRTQT